MRHNRQESHSTIDTTAFFVHTGERYHRADRKAYGDVEQLQDPRGIPPAMLTYATNRPPVPACEVCQGYGSIFEGRFMDFEHAHPCEACQSVGYSLNTAYDEFAGGGISLGIDPYVPTICMPGTWGKMAVLAARYRFCMSNAGNDLIFFDIASCYLPGDAKEPEAKYTGGE
jgi:hypothetical protein